ncbi:MAG: hypothetical protein ACI8XM_002319 [Haloarculaceae archaeon]
MYINFRKYLRSLLFGYFDRRVGIEHHSVPNAVAVTRRDVYTIDPGKQTIAALVSFEEDGSGRVVPDSSDGPEAGCLG